MKKGVSHLTKRSLIMTTGQNNPISLQIDNTQFGETSTGDKNRLPLTNNGASTQNELSYIIDTTGPIKETFRVPSTTNIPSTKDDMLSSPTPERNDNYSYTQATGLQE